MRGRGLILVALAAGAVMSGCATSSNMETAVLDTRTRVVKLQQDLSPQVSQLSTTVAELTANVSAADQQSRQLASLVEETRAKLDAVEAKVDEIVRVMYRDAGLSGASAPSATRWQTTPDSVTTSPPVVNVPEATQPGATAAPPPTQPLGYAPAEDTLTVPDDIPATAAPSNALTDYQNAQKSFINEDYELALRQYDDYLKRYPGTEYCHSAQFWKGECYMYLNQFQQAVSEFDRLRAEYPTSNKVPIAIYKQAQAYANLMQNDKAVTLLRELVENYPTSAAADKARAKLEGNSQL